ncbi:MAG: nitronate monooxygenase [Pseudomonadota bacterium]
MSNKESMKQFLTDAGIELPILCGAMYPCSNLNLIAAVSESGGMGILQPVTTTYVEKIEFSEALTQLRSMTSKPIGMNCLIEGKNEKYLKRMSAWIDQALSHGVRFFVTSLGNPKWVVDKVAPFGGKVYHDITDIRWAKKVADVGIHGFICVNNRAGGHAGDKSSETLIKDFAKLGLPVLCAGGVSTPQDFRHALDLGYAGVQMGTRFIATTECFAHKEYKDAIVKAEESDIVLTDLISGVPVAVINTPYIERVGTKAGPILKWLLKNEKTKHKARSFLFLKSIWQLPQAARKGSRYNDYWQAGQSVKGIDAVEPVSKIMQSFRNVL